MAKCHKSNARFKKQKKRNKRVNDGFFEREKKLNQSINNFIHSYKNLKRPLTVEEYKKMDKMRLEIKRLFALQEGELWKKSYKRKRVYYKQLDKFKYFYVAWKRYTYYIYLNQRYGMPLHLIKGIVFYKNISHNIKYTIYTL